MCSPEVLSKVRAEITRRRLLGQAGVAAAAGIAVPAFGARAALAQDATPMASPVVTALPGGFSSIIDLTHVMTPEFPVFPGGEQLQLETLVTVENDGYYIQRVTFAEHTGTHMDAPAHFDADGVTADQLPVEILVAPLCVLDISERAASDPDAQGTVDDLTAWEEENGPLPDGAFVALYSGWESRLSDPESYINLDAEGVQHYPGWHPDAGAFLVTERNIVGIGVDTLSLDYGASTDFATHVAVLSAGKYGLENLANLAQLPPTGATVFAGGPKHLNASGGPTRAIALM